jgi:hypothetical protein
MFGNIIGVILFLCLAAGAVYLFVIKSKMDKKKEAVPVVPAKTTQRETGAFIGLGNPPPINPTTGKPDPATRPLWQFKYAPTHYGKSLNIFFGTSTSPVLATLNKDDRYDGPNGIVVKKSSETGLLRIHDHFGSKDTICTIEY